MGNLLSATPRPFSGKFSPPFVFTTFVRLVDAGEEAGSSVTYAGLSAIRLRVGAWMEWHSVALDPTAGH